MMKLDVAAQAFDMQDISNRRFMYNPKTGILVLGQQYGKTRGLPGSHADDLAQPESKTALMILFAAGWVLERAIPQVSFILPRMWTPKTFPCSIGRLTP